MDFAQRLEIVRRICDRRVFGVIDYNGQSVEVCFTDPTLPILAQSDFVYKKALERIRAETDIFTIEESYDILRKRGQWTDVLEEEMEILKKDVDTLTTNLNNLRFNKSATRAAKRKIEQKEKRINELFFTKNQLRGSTAEFIAEKSRKRFIISKIATAQYPELLDSQLFKDALIVYYFEESGISESTLRELARTDPWRLYWTTSKDTGTSLFPHSAIEMSDLQYALVYWTRVYDFAFNSMNRPPDDVINDDSKFDSWYKSEAKRIEAETKQNAAEDILGGHSKGYGHQEIFLPADSEGAKEVYELNDLQSKIRVKQREKAIREKKEVSEINLPDVKQDLMTRVNQMASEGIMNRSK
jgi:hypothetical protein